MARNESAGMEINSPYLPALRHPINCVLSPQILTNIILRGNPRQREFALRTLSRDQSFRTARSARIERRRALQGQIRQPLVSVLEATKERFIYNAGNRVRIPGTLVRREGDPPVDDQEVNEAYDGLGATLDLYWNVFNRDSIDGKGMILNAIVHFAQDYDNALWDGRRMIFGDGDGEIFTPFTRSVDVIGHELTHGVIEHTANLVYTHQPGALNESLADVFGTLVKQYQANQTVDQASWLIGEELLLPGVNGVAIRSMSNPGTAFDDPVLGKDDQPADMDGYRPILEDNGGVHKYSGIPNHAFFLAATEIGGYAWENAGEIWYRSLLSPYLRATANFEGFARLTTSVARALFGPRSREYQAVRNGWAGVKIFV